MRSSVLDSLFNKAAAVHFATLAKNEAPAEACEFYEIFRSIFYHYRIPQGRLLGFSLFQDSSLIMHFFLQLDTRRHFWKNENELDEDIILVVGKKIIEQRHLSNFQKQPPEVVCKKQLIVNLTKFTGKRLCLAALLKDPITGVFL